MAFLLGPSIVQAIAPAPFSPAGRAGSGVSVAARRQARRHETALARSLAADLLAGLGAETTVVGVADDCSPIWPAGFVGSITHAAGLAGVAIGRSSELRGLGVDIEGIFTPQVAHEVESVCLDPAERRLVSACANRLLASTLCFSAKEALFKCLNPLTRCRFDFTEVEVREIDFGRRRLCLCLRRDLDAEFCRGRVMTGAFAWDDLRVFTSFVLSRAPGIGIQARPDRCGSGNDSLYP